MAQQSLFGGGGPRDKSSPAALGGVPLAERMRPTRLDEVVGQAHLVGEGKPLRQMAQAGRLPSVLLWGPPGTGKTTLARLLAQASGRHFVSLSAVTAGIKEVREVVEEARVRQAHGALTVLFLDEIHRFNKAQQDALLPWVESGLLTLVGATTENPSFEVNAALLSRMTVYTLHALGPADIEVLLTRAHARLTDPASGVAPPPISMGALQMLARLADGDARKGLGLLEQLVRVTSGRDAEVGELTEHDVRELLTLRGPRYDKGGEEHYNVISAFIKSMRGSDPDAAVYWLTRMLEAGEDITFIARRMVIFASEDVGNADPRALMVATAAAQAVQLVGLPEAGINLAQAAAYLAVTPKSKASYLALRKAQELIAATGSLPVPLHLRNAPTRLMEREGYGQGWQDPHAHPGHFVRQRYLPEELPPEPIYRPTDQGEEARITARLRALWGESKT